MENKSKISVIIAGAGSGSRSGLKDNKLFYKIGAQTVLETTLSKFLDSGLIDEFIVTASKKDFDFVRSLLPQDVIVVEGGKTRTDSIKNALNAISGDIVLIHDGARPFVSVEIIKNNIETAKKYGSAITATPSRDTVLSGTEDVIENYLGKAGLYCVQTPQTFMTSHIKKAYSMINGESFNDDGEIYKAFIGETHLVLGSTKNTKLTYPEDFENLYSNKTQRFGVGFDCHKLVENRKLILGGIEIPHDKGLLGHSDADVLTHAIMDAILSSVAMRDIGYWFSDKDSKYKDANSIELLKTVLEMIKEKGFRVDSISAVIMAQKPKLLGFIPKITENLANVIGIDEENIGIGATTLEGLGFVGREEGICANATAVISEI